MNVDRDSQTSIVSNILLNLTLNTNLEFLLLMHICFVFLPESVHLPHEAGYDAYMCGYGKNTIHSIILFF